MKRIGALLLFNFALWLVLVALRMLEVIHWNGWLISMPLIADELACGLILFFWMGRHS